MLRIDETSKTLVAPPAGGLVTEVAPTATSCSRSCASSWEAFAGELGQPSLRFVVQGQAPGLEVLAFDEQAGRAVVVGVASEVSDVQLTQALSGAASVAAMDAASLAAVHESLQAAVPGDSPQIVLLASAFEARTLATVDWLTRRHGLEISCFVLSVFRFGAERLLSIRREYPARDVERARSGRRGPADAVRRRSRRRRRAGRQRPLDAPARPLAEFARRLAPRDRSARPVRDDAGRCCCAACAGGSPACWWPGP